MTMHTHVRLVMPAHLDANQPLLRNCLKSSRKAAKPQRKVQIPAILVPTLRSLRLSTPLRLPYPRNREATVRDFVREVILIFQTAS